MNLTHPLTIRRIAAIKAVTTGRALSVYEISGAVFICHQSALRYVRELIGSDPARGEQMHIAGWREVQRGKWAALYTWGAGEHAIKPVPRTGSELTRDYRARIRKDPVKRAFSLARARARDRADRAAKKPQTPFSALFGRSQA